MKSMGIIGFGQFGQLAAREMAPRFDVVVHDSAVAPSAIAEAGHRPASMEEAAGSDVIVLAVPVQVLEDAIIRTAAFARPGATILDVASVKQLPSQWLLRHVPDSIDIVPTHPLFGPQSAAQGVAGRQLVICPARGDRHLAVASFGEDMGMRVRIVPAEEHDREMAYVQALTHLIGRSLSAMAIPDEYLKTQSYQHLLDLCGLIGNDSFELFTAIQTMNPHAPDVVREFVSRAQGLLDAVGVGEN